MCVCVCVCVCVCNKVNDKEYTFFRNSEFHAACATVFSRMKLQ